MRIFTCTPVAFGGGADFFARDSGLLCRGFQTIGVLSHAVMPGHGSGDDEPDLIRTDYRNLESADWWRSHQLDGVVLYAWGRPKFRKVASAIHDAGIFLILNQDNGGLVSPLCGFRKWLEEQWILSGQGRGIGARFRFLQQTAMGLSKGLLVTDPLRARHLKQGNVIACVSPMAAEYYRRLCGIYGGRRLADRITVIPHPVEPGFKYRGSAKRKQVACVGRWTDPIQKRPWLLVEVINALLSADEEVSVVIVGEPDSDLLTWRRSLGEIEQRRVRLAGKVDRGELAGILNESRVFYSPSAFESFGIAAAEALCSGCSIVSGRSVSMASFEWFVSEESGTLAEMDNAKGHLNALRAELDEWDRGLRNPDAISATWSVRFHSDKVAARIVEMIGADV
jgi:glycosyltransferase involved in cell wall biosynthesis